jgi:hypothetical protein
MLVAASWARADIPWNDGDAPPAVAGVKLGESKEDLVKQLGAPTKEEKIDPDGSGLTFAKPQIVVTLTPAKGVASVILTGPESGDISGIHIGTTREEVADKWGIPKLMHGLAVYRVGWWAVAMRFDDGHSVTQLYIGRVT